MSADERSAVRGRPTWTERLSGAPLDFLKLAAALLMLGDHVNTVLLAGAEPLLWSAGRVAFPLFCLVAACHIARGADAGRYLTALLVVAVPTQPIFAWAFGGALGNVLFTIAAGSALAFVVLRLAPALRHIFFAAAGLVAVSIPLLAKSGVDFGLAGMMLPAAIAAALGHGRAYLPWAVLFTLLLNGTPPRPFSDPWWLGPLNDGLFALVGVAAMGGLALLLAGRARFLPRYALYLFYPAHLAALALLRAYWSS